MQKKKPGGAPTPPQKKGGGGGGPFGSHPNNRAARVLRHVTRMAKPTDVPPQQHDTTKYHRRSKPATTPQCIGPSPATAPLWADAYCCSFGCPEGPKPSEVFQQILRAGRARRRSATMTSINALRISFDAEFHLSTAGCMAQTNRKAPQSTMSKDKHAPVYKTRQTRPAHKGHPMIYRPSGSDVPVPP